MATRRVKAGKGLAPDLPVGLAARRTIAGRLEPFDAEVAAARAGHVAGIHELRIVARRLRTALRLFDGALPRRAAAQAEKELAWLGHTVGAVRDLDVLAAALAARAKKLDPWLAAGFTTIQHHVRDRRQAAHALLVVALDSARARRLRPRLAALAGPPAHTAEDATTCAEVAPRLVRPLVQRVLRTGRRLAGATDVDAAALHRLRVRVKRLRYALEALDGVGAGAARALARRLAKLQGLLGDHHDAVTQSAWVLAEVPALAGDVEAVLAAGAFAEALRARARRLEDRVPRYWRRVDRRKRVASALRELAAPEAA